jgi:hypothetical protein
MSNYVSVILCRRCGSRYVEVQEWDSSRAVIRCRGCGAEEHSEKFTLGRCRVENSELTRLRESAPGRGEYER